MTIETALVALTKQFDEEHEVLRQRGQTRWMPPTTQQVIDAVDLSVAHTPVLPAGESWPRQCTPTVDGRWVIYDWAKYPYCWPTPKHTWGLLADEIQLYRARFLVMRDAIFETVITGNYRLFPELSRYSTMERVLPAFGIKWIPGEGVKEALKKNYEKTGYIQADGCVYMPQFE